MKHVMGASCRFLQYFERGIPQVVACRWLCSTRKLALRSLRELSIVVKHREGPSSQVPNKGGVESFLIYASGFPNTTAVYIPLPDTLRFRPCPQVQFSKRPKPCGLAKDLELVPVAGAWNVSGITGFVTVGFVRF